MSKFEQITWREYCKWVSSKTLSKVEEHSDHVIMHFSDGAEAMIDSTYKEHAAYSEYTPGWTEATMPTVRFYDPNVRKVMCPHGRVVDHTRQRGKYHGTCACCGVPSDDVNCGEGGYCSIC